MSETVLYGWVCLPCRKLFRSFRHFEKNDHAYYTLRVKEDE